ncbi:sensor histidine kinase [Treponema sp. OMZ 840]|uniref:ATP-binding protein n=1 Tax=Treponema sp. OMZ 840 TaxID=244313 RepID=UPI003D8D6501
MHYTLCDLIADLTQNAVEAASSHIRVEFTESDDKLTVYIRDNGKGMDGELLKKVRDPFYTDGIKHPNRKIGMGIPFLIQTTADTGGNWKIDSVPGKGTVVYMCFDLSNIDTPPVGDVCRLFRQLLIFPGSYELEIVRTKHTKDCSLNYTLLRSELSDALGKMETAADLALLDEFLQSQENG